MPDSPSGPKGRARPLPGLRLQTRRVQGSCLLAAIKLLGRESLGAPKRVPHPPAILLQLLTSCFMWTEEGRNVSVGLSTLAFKVTRGSNPSLRFSAWRGEGRQPSVYLTFGLCIWFFSLLGIASAFLKLVSAAAYKSGKV